MFIRGFTFIIAVLIILLVISPILTAAVFAAIIPIVCFSIIYGKAIRKIQVNIQQKKAEMTTCAEESFSNVRTVKAFSNEKEEALKFDGSN